MESKTESKKQSTTPQSASSGWSQRPQMPVNDGSKTPSVCAAAVFRSQLTGRQVTNPREQGTDMGIVENVQSEAYGSDRNSGHNNPTRKTWAGYYAL